MPALPRGSYADTNNRSLSLAFRSDSETLASGSTDRGNTRSGYGTCAARMIASVVLHNDVGFNDLAFGPDGMRLAVSDNGANGLRVLDLRPSGQPRVLPGDYGASNQLAFSPDDRFLGSAVVKEVIQLWNLSDLTAPPTVLRGHRGKAWSVAFSPDGKMLSSTGIEDGTVRLWRLGNPIEEIAALPGAGSVDRTVQPGW